MYIVLSGSGVLTTGGTITDKKIPEQVTYLSVRPDPDRVLPGGYVNPRLLKNQPAPVK